MHCPLGNHLLRGPGVYITNPRHVRFINKLFPDFLPSEKVCAKCKQDIGIAYNYKIKRALATRVHNGSLISSHTTDESSVVNSREDNERILTRSNVGKRPVAPSTYNDDDKPTTSAQAAAKRQREERQKIVQQQNLLAINLQRGSRLPHIQPVARRQQFVHANPDIMDIYVRGMIGG